MPFLFQDLAETFVLLNLGLVLVFISCVRHVSNLHYCDLLRANHVLEHGLLTVSFVILLLSTFHVINIISCDHLMRSTIMMSGLI